MICVKPRKHFLHDPALSDDMLLRSPEDAVGPRSAGIVRNDHNPGAARSHCHHSSLQKGENAFPIVVLPPRRIDMKCIKLLDQVVGQRITYIVQSGIDALRILPRIREFQDAVDHSFIKVEYHDLSRSLVQDPACEQMNNGKSYGITIAYEDHVLPRQST